MNPTDATPLLHVLLLADPERAHRRDMVLLAARRRPRRTRRRLLSRLG
ncbi:hypothetical protein [Geodermatophilus sp. SYSU D00815]